MGLRKSEGTQGGVLANSSPVNLTGHTFHTANDEPKHALNQLCLESYADQLKRLL